MVTDVYFLLECEFLFGAERRRGALNWFEGTVKVRQRYPDTFHQYSNGE